MKLKRSFSSEVPLGLTLMEVIFALGMISTVLVIVFTVLIGGLRMQERAELVEQGSSLIREQLEEIKAHPFSIQEGHFDGRAGDPTVNGFPPPPYPSGERGRELWLEIQVEAHDERIWYVRVTAMSEDQQMTSIETMLAR